MTEAQADSMIQKGLILLKQNRYNEAAQIFQDILGQNPHNPYALNLLATCQYHLPGQRSKALETIQQALHLEPDDPSHYEMQALILTDLDRHNQAMQAIQKALGLDPDSCFGHAVRSYIFIKQEQWPHAEQAARKALSLNADDLFAGNLLATALRMQNKLDESQTLIFDTLAKEPEDALSHSNCGWVYLQRKDYSKALVHFREALRLDPMLETARIGMLETFKSKSLFYRFYLNYSFFMAQQTKAVRILIIMSLLVVFRLLRNWLRFSFEGRLAPLAIVVGLLYLFFFFWTWLSGGLGNFIILNDRFARYALNREEKLEAVLVGGSVVLGIVILAFAFVVTVNPLLILGGTLILAAIPWTCIFNNQNKTGRIFYGSLAILFWILGLVGTIGGWIFGLAKMTSLFGIMILLFALCTWLGAFGFLRK